LVFPSEVHFPEQLLAIPEANLYQAWLNQPQCFLIVKNLARGLDSLNEYSTIEIEAVRQGVIT
jgi:hypothetical protein